MRHVIGGRPEGWNYSAGQTQGWGGIDIGMFECLTRTAPLFQVEATDIEPLPNLAKSWEWSEDGYKLTMHLIEGAKWSDGDPFDAEDVMFYWDDNVVDPNVSPLNGATPETFGVGTDAEGDRQIHDRMDLQGSASRASIFLRWPMGRSARARRIS